MKDSQSQKSLASTCRLLVEQRWLPLRRLSLLLGYRHGTGIYGRQRSTNPAHRIPTIKVGGTFRVHYDDVIHTLENPLKEDVRDAYNELLSYIRRLEHQHNNSYMERHKDKDKDKDPEHE